MKHNPFKPDEKRPWCSRCRAHTPCEKFQRTSSATPVLRCNRCEGSMLEDAAGLGHSSRLGCIVPAWGVIGAVLLCMGATLLLFFLSDPKRDEDTLIGVGFFLLCGAGSIAMAVWLSRLQNNWNSWVKEQGEKTDEELEEEAKRWRQGAPARKKKKRRRTTNRKNFTSIVILGAIFVAVAKSWLESRGVEEPWSWGPLVPLALYILYVYNFTRFVSPKEKASGEPPEKDPDSAE